MKYIAGYYPMDLGCDPELFISRETGKVRKRRAIVGSEAIIPPDGLEASYGSKIVRDGVQVELHPVQSHCRANLSNSLQYVFRALDNQISKTNKEQDTNLAADFRSVVKLSKGDLAKLSPEARILGCTPSKNVYGRKHIQKDGTRFLSRSAAGHIHFGYEAHRDLIDPKRFVHLLDALVGNTMVLVDRDPLAPERRKIYGRAGEYRTPEHGLEYRTLSNFWLKNYKLMSLATGMAKLAFRIASQASGVLDKKAYINNGQYTHTYIFDAEEQIMKNVDLKKIELAINTNDFDLAKANYEQAVRPFLETVTNGDGLEAANLSDFDFFVDKIRAAELAGADDPIKVWFPEDPLTHWITKKEGHNTGWESWLDSYVRQERLSKATMKAFMPAVMPPFEQPVINAPAFILEEDPIYNQPFGAAIIN